MKKFLSFFVAGLVSFGTALPAFADAEWTENTPYYEEDAWYDVTEWFDGNDYNPTDEEFWEWDDEVYQVSDQDDAGDWYGYDTVAADDDWFYDYYDYGYDTYADYDLAADDDLYEAGYRYYDLDNDGVYDAYVSYYDWDDDGFYEDYNYYSFADTTNKKQEARAKKESPKQSRQVKLSGKIDKAKQVNVRGNTHLVVHLEGKQKGSVDLGSAKTLNDLNLKLGEDITVKGMKTKVGDKQVILAQQLMANGETQEINRQRRQLQGKIQSTQTAKIRGQQHVIAMVNTQKGKVAVDLGPKDHLQISLDKGEEITFTGAPVKVNDRRLLMAQSVEHEGETIQVNRFKKKQG